MVYYEQGSFSLVCFHGWLNYPVRNNHLYSFYTRLKLQWIVDHIISYIWLLSICGSQKTQLDSFFSHQSNIYIQSKSSAIIYRSEFLKNSNIKGCFFSENSMGLKKNMPNHYLKFESLKLHFVLWRTCRLPTLTLSKRFQLTCSSQNSNKKFKIVKQHICLGL